MFWRAKKSPEKNRNICDYFYSPGVCTTACRFFSWSCWIFSVLALFSFSSIFILCMYWLFRNFKSAVSCSILLKEAFKSSGERKSTIIFVIHYYVYFGATRKNEENPIFFFRNKKFSHTRTYVYVHMCMYTHTNPHKNTYLYMSYK